MSNKSDDICDEIGRVMGNEIRESAGYGSLSCRGQERVANKLKELVRAIKKEIRKELQPAPEPVEEPEEVYYEHKHNGLRSLCSVCNAPWGATYSCKEPKHE